MKKGRYFLLLALILLCAAMFALLTACEPDKNCDHDYECTVTKEPDCENEGIKEYICAECEDSYTEKIEALGHQPSDWITVEESDCGNDGLKKKVCITCDKELEVDVIGKSGEHVPVIDARIEPTETTTGLTEGSHCDVCGEILVHQDVIPALNENIALSSKAFEVNGTEVNGKLSHSYTEFNFSSDITVVDNATWILSKDPHGNQVINADRVPLSEGDNRFYIRVTDSDETVTVYTVNIYRNRMLTVTFDTDGGTGIDPQYVEEGTVVTPPSTSKIGYTFDSWSYDFTAPVTSDITAKAIWVANTDTAYIVEYYLQNQYADGYDEPIVEYFTGITDALTGAEGKTFPHFTLNEAKSDLNSRISPDGSLVVELYYERNVYRVYVNDSTLGSATNVGTYTYREDRVLTLTARVSRIGYYFAGWYSDGELITAAPEFTTQISQNIEARFEVVPQMQNFNFTSDSRLCTITGVKDKSLTEITIPDNFVTSIATRAFEGCKNLKKVYIGRGVQTIEKYAFSGCENLASVTVGSSVTSIATDAFYNCYRLIEVINLSYNLNITAGSSDNGKIAYYAKEVHRGESKLVVVDDFVFYPLGGIYYLHSYIGESTSIVLPDNFRGYDYEIYGNAFRKNTALTAVTLGRGVTAIGDSAFYGCSALKSVVISENVTSIGASAFYECDALTSVTVPNKVVTIGDKAFYQCDSLISAVIGNGVTTIGDEAFYNCPNLSSVTVGSSLNTVGEKAFWGCNRLIEVINGSSRTMTAGNAGYGYIAYYAREIHTGASRLVSVGDFVFYVGDEACYLHRYTGDSVDVVLPDNYNGRAYEISSYLFYERTDIKSVTLGSDVTYIGDYAFYGCDGLISMILKERITGIGKHAFSGCDNLSRVVLNEGVTVIGNDAFSGCDNLTNVILCDGITKIGDYAFSGCISLESINLPESITNIGIYAFSDCQSLTGIIIPDNVQSIGTSTFEDCSGLASVTLPKNLTSIGSNAFSGCYRLIEVINRSSLRLTAGQKSNGDVAYYAKEIHTGESKLVSSGDFVFYVSDIGCYLHSYTGELAEIVLPANYNGRAYAIYSGAFGERMDITSVIIPEGVTAIEKNAFYECKNLVTVVIPDSVTAIGGYAFYRCTSLADLTIGSGVKVIENYTFAACVSLTDIILPAGITSINDHAFSGNEALRSITIPAGVTSIGNNAFRDCEGLSEIIFLGTEAEWSNISKGSSWDYNVDNYTVTYAKNGE